MSIDTTLKSKFKIFEVGVDKLTDLTFHPTRNNEKLHYFYDATSNQLIKKFLIGLSPKIALFVEITLLKIGEEFKPRVAFLKQNVIRDAEDNVINFESSLGEKNIEFRIDFEESSQRLWLLLNFINSLQDLTISKNDKRWRIISDTNFRELLNSRNKVEVLSAIGETFAGQISNHDLSILQQRRETLSEFQDLIRNGDPQRPLTEARLQNFFEKNQWILGYGLPTIFASAFNEEGLETTTTGSAFDSGGKRIDALLKSKGDISSLVFVEIKRPNTKLLASKPYRPPDVYAPSSELIGGISQVQKTVEKFIRKRQIVEEKRRPDGKFENWYLTVKPRMIVIAGQLSEFIENGSPNSEKSSSFELFRRSVLDVEIFTFDELLERAKFIVNNDG